MKIWIVSKDNYKELGALKRAFKVSKDCDICIAVGGDGTFVRAAEEYDCPILPMRSREKNSTGYYADVNINDIRKVIKRLKQGEYSEEVLTNKLEISFNGKKYFATNEVRLNNLLEEVSFKVYSIIGGRRERTYPYIISGDGLIITSAVGSTAYNRSAGGPIILTPSVLCLTLLNADGPYNNPIIIDNNTELEVKISKYSGRLRYDSSDIGLLKPGDSFRARLSDRKVRIVRLKGMREDFADKLDRMIRSKMLE